MLEGSKFHSIMGVGAGGVNNNANNFYDHGAFYHKLGEGSNMSVDSQSSIQSSNPGGSVSMSIDNDSVGSNNTLTLLRNRGGPQSVPTGDISMGHSVYHGGGTGTGDDELTSALMDNRFPTEGLQNFDEWTLDLRRLSMGAAFAQGAFGKLYRGTYGGEEVAIKLLVRPLDNLEMAQTLEQQFAQEVTMLATLRHPNIVRFIGACRKPMVWCIVTEYAKGGSVRQFLMKRHNRSVPLKLAVKQALDVARGMEYVHGLGFIHRDLKSENLLIAGDKSIKIADFGVARIEVKTEGMTPETGTYRWMAP